MCRNHKHRLVGLMEAKQGQSSFAAEWHDWNGDGNLQLCIPPSKISITPEDASIASCCGYRCRKSGLASRSPPWASRKLLPSSQRVPTVYHQTGSSLEGHHNGKSVASRGFTVITLKSRHGVPTSQLEK